MSDFFLSDAIKQNDTDESLAVDGAMIIILSSLVIRTLDSQSMGCGFESRQEKNDLRHYISCFAAKWCP